MIVTFYDRAFRGLQDNASLIVANGSYSLIRRGVEMDELKCTCEAFTANIQPTFVVVKNDRGNYVYGALAGIPQLDKNNQTKVTGSDLKTMLKSDVLLDLSNFNTEQSSLKEFIQTVFDAWNEQVNQNSFNCELIFGDEIKDIPWDHQDYLRPSGEHIARYNVWEDLLAPYLKYYALFMTTKIELAEKKVIFYIGGSMDGHVANVKLWELGIYDYGKWIAKVNETQGFVLNTSTNEVVKKGYRWVVTSKNEIVSCDDTSKEDIANLATARDCYPIKRKIIVKETETDDEDKIRELLNEANTEALTTLADSMFKENLEISNEEFLQRFGTRRSGSIVASNELEEKKVMEFFGTRFCIFAERGDKEPFKELPCGELHYNENGLKKIQIGYRFTGLQFII